MSPPAPQRPPAESARTRYAHLTEDGTGYILGGSLLAGVAAYIYQFLAGRSLGAADFAPVSVLLTIHFVVFIVVLLPIEQLVVRRLTLNRDAADIPRQASWLVAVTLAVAVTYAWLQADQLLRGDLRFVWFVAATIVTHTVFVIARGRLAGWRRFRAYGLASGAASLARLAVAGAVLAIRPTASGFALGLIVGPLVVLLWRPGRRVEVARTRVNPDQAASLSDDGLLTGLVLASAASQLLLLAGPLLVVVVGGGEALVSVAFATFTLSRAPLTFGYNLLARVLPPFTEMAARGERTELRAWGRGIGMASAVLAVLAAAVGALAGPAVIGAAFGSDFRPEALVAGMVACGVVIAGAGLFVGQVLVARGEPKRLAGSWLGGVMVTGVTLAQASGGALDRVALAFLLGEVAALTGLVISAVRVPGTSHRGYQLAKRSIDIAVSMVVLTLAAPLLVILAAAVRLGSSGPAFFRQERVGKEGRSFAILKLRTMRADHGEAVFVEHLQELTRPRSGDAELLRIADDPRITRLGSILRKTSLDELPNLWNVLGGSMSLVGPRPLVPSEAELVGRDHLRFSVKPGVTGLAQVSGRDEITLDERSALDAAYVARRSLRVDSSILLRTLVTVVRRPGD